MNYDAPDVTHALAQYAVCQSYSSYADHEHQTWRNAMRALTGALESRCVIPHIDALSRCGLKRDRLPRLEEINRALSMVGWESIVVEGFIPPPTFMLLQANCILPITRQVRSVAQQAYTPIPDIIHEAAGHLPMLVDPNYRRFMQRFGEKGSQFGYGELDQRVFKCQKEYAELLALPQPDSSRVAELESELAELRNAQRRAVTPACQISRFHWWTVEYGLIGEPAKLYGAGLLSSYEEAEATDTTPQIPLSLDCLGYDYEISRMQPQLFVASDWGHLNSELDRFFQLEN